MSVVVVVGEVQLHVVAVKQKVLTGEVEQPDILIASDEYCVKPTVGVLLERSEVSDVPLIAIRFEISEEPNARVIVREDEAAKIACETLYSAGYRKEVVVRAQVRKF